MEIKGVILFGDSVFFGIGASYLRSSCGRILQSFVSIPILIKGYSKYTTEDALKRLKVDVLDQNNYSHVIILFGNNDCRLNKLGHAYISLEQYEENLVKIINSIKLNKKFPILSNLQPIDTQKFLKIYPEIKEYMIRSKITPSEWQKEYSDICIRIAIEEKIPLLDIRTVLSKNKHVLSVDGLHPNDKGHRIIALRIVNLLKRLDPKLTYIS